MTEPVAANDFARQWQDIREEALAAVDRVGRSGWLILGEEVDAFERELAAWWGVPHAVGVARGLVLLAFPPMFSSYDVRYAVPPIDLLAVSAGLGAAAIATTSRRTGAHGLADPPPA